MAGREDHERPARRRAFGLFKLTIELRHWVLLKVKRRFRFVYYADRKHGKRQFVVSRSRSKCERLGAACATFFTFDPDTAGGPFGEVGQIMMLRSAVIWVCAAFTVSCESSRVDKLEKQNQEILSQLHRQEAVQDFDLQAKCAQSAKAYFAETRAEYRTILGEEQLRADILSTLNYTDHYSKSLNRCLIRIISYQTVTGKGMAFAVDVYDVYERKLFATYFGLKDSQKGPPTVCSVNETSCNSLDDFETKLKLYMAN